MKSFFLLIVFYSCCHYNLFSQTGSTGGAQAGNISGWPTGSDTLCTNGITVFQKRYGGSKEDIGHKIIPEPDSGYVIAGVTKSAGNGSNDAWLMKINKRGAVLWSKIVGGANDDDFVNVTRTIGGGYIAIGTTRSFGNAAGDILLAKFDNNGNLSWSKRYNAGTVNGELGSVVVQTSDKGYVIGGTHNFAPGTANGFMMKTDSSGNVLWNKVFDLGSSDVLVDLVNDNDTIMAAGFYRGVTFHDNFAMKVNSANGNLYWSKRYDINDRNNGAIEIFKTTGGYYINTFDNASFSVFDYRIIPVKIDRDGNVLFAKNIDVPGQSLPHYGSMAPTADGGFVAAASGLVDGDIYIHKINAGGNLSWSKKYIRPGTEFIFEILPAVGGGYIGVGSQNSQQATADSTNLFVIKTDTAGGIPGCNFEVATPVLSNASIVTSTLNWSITSPAINTATVNPTVTNALTASNTFCIACIVPLPEDTTCTNGITVFQKQYGGNKEDIGYKIIPEPDSGYIIAGVTKSIGNGSKDAWLMKINKRGTVQWSRIVGGANDDDFVNVSRTVDGGYIAIGTTRSFGNAAGDILLAKFDNNGNLSWSKRYNAGTVNGEEGAVAVQTSDKGYVIGGTHNFAPGTANAFMMKTDSLGTVLWNKVFDLGSSDALSDLVNDNDTIFATGHYYGLTYHDGFAMKVNSANGSLYWSKRYDINDRNNGFIEIFKTTGGYLINTFDNASFTVLDYRMIPLKIDGNGNVLSARNLDVPGQSLPHYGSLRPTSDGGMVVASSSILAAGDIFIHKINAGGNLTWSKKYIRTGTEFIYDIMPVVQGGYIAVGLQNSQPTIADSSNLFVIKTDTTGGTPGCNFEAATPVLSNASIVTSTLNWTITSPAINTATVNPTVTNALTASNTFCIACIKLPKPTGSLRILEGSTGSHSIRLFPNPVNEGPVNLIIDAEFNDIAEISVIDWHLGNVVFKSQLKTIHKGRNHIQFNLNGKLIRSRYYILKIRFREHEQSMKIFSIN